MRLKEKNIILLKFDIYLTTITIAKICIKIGFHSMCLQYKQCFINTEKLFVNKMILKRFLERSYILFTEFFFYNLYF